MLSCKLYMQSWYASGFHGVTLQISNFHMTISGSLFVYPAHKDTGNMWMRSGGSFFAIWSTTWGSRSPDFQNASGMFQTQMCDSQLPHLGLGTMEPIRGRIQGPRVNPRLSKYRSSYVSTCLWISCLIYISRFKTSLIWSVIIMARESHCPLSYSTHQNKDLKIP